jgi:hypothetical protein
MCSICKYPVDTPSFPMLIHPFKITSLFQCPNIPTSTQPGAPTPTLAHFVAYALHRTRLPSIVTSAALLLLKRLKTRFPAARGSSGHRLFISAFMIASKVICDDTYSNQSWGIVAQKMFALKEINQMEREMCGYLEWNLNVTGEEVEAFEAEVRMEHGPKAISKASSSSHSSSDGSVTVSAVPGSSCYPTPDTTPDAQSRPIRPVPSPFKNKSSYQSTTLSAPPSPPASPAYLHPSHHHSPAPHFTASASSSLASSPASDDCKTPSPVALASSATRCPPKSIDMSRAFDGRHQRQHTSAVNLSGYPVNVGAW